MTTIDRRSGSRRVSDDEGAVERRLVTLERLLKIRAVDLPTALMSAAQLLAEALDAEKVDAFVLDTASETLVALGTSSTPLGAKQKALGLDRLPLANGGKVVRVFHDRMPVLANDSAADGDDLAGVIDALGVRSQIAVPFAAGEDDRGVLLACSTQTRYFSDGDLAFLDAAADWVGAVAERARLAGELARAAAAEASRLTAEEIVTILAHDLGNHFTPLRGRIDLMRRRAQREGRTADLRDLDEVRAKLDAVTMLTTDLTDVSRIERGAFTIVPGAVRLVELVREISSAAASDAVQVEVRAASEILIPADPQRLRQALANVVGNAVKHSPSGSAVDVELGTERRGTDEWATICITDQGTGVPAEIVPRLFTRFAAGPRSTGLGLGLYLAHRIAVAHGGTLTFETPGPVGARFKFELPGADTRA